MDLPKAKTHSFIVKIWLEEVSDAGNVLWRGHITHVPSGERRYFDTPAAIAHFIAPYLELFGVRLSLAARLRRRAVAFRRRVTHGKR